jgi:hypothetical protein
MGSRRDKKRQVDPNEEGVRVVGGTSPDMNLAIEAWATLLAHASRDVEDVFTPEEWGQMAPIIGRARHEPGVWSAGRALADLLANQLGDGPLTQREREEEKWWTLDHRIKFNNGEE